VDGDGTNELIVLGSVQNAAQSDRFRGVALFVVRNDGTRPTAWVTPHHVPAYLAGLWDFDGTNYVGATNQVSVAELFGDRPGPEMVFAGFDGIIHCVDASAQTVWQHQYTMDDEVLTAGVAIADLTGDGTPEIVFATYSPDEGKSELVILEGGGAVAHEIPLPRNGSMAVPTIADVDGNGDVEIVVALKESPDGEPQVLVYDVPGSADNCLLWPTGRGNLRRDGYVPSP
jgi:FG-GAP-like repeat